MMISETSRCLVRPLFSGAVSAAACRLSKSGSDSENPSVPAKPILSTSRRRIPSQLGKREVISDLHPQFCSMVEQEFDGIHQAPRQVFSGLTPAGAVILRVVSRFEVIDRGPPFVVRRVASIEG